MTLLIVLPSLAIFYSYSPEALGETDAEGEVELLGDREREMDVDGLTELDGDIEVLADGLLEALGDSEALDEAEATASQMVTLINDDPNTDATSKNSWILHEHYLKERDTLHKLKCQLIDLMGDKK